MKDKKKFERERLHQIIKIAHHYNLLSNLIRQQNVEQVCDAFEKLGPTFIKLGQVLSTRTDLITEQFAQGLKKLQDDDPIDSFPVVKETFYQSMGKTIEQCFKTFATVPFASGSIGQVYHATLFDGTPVVVKIQHHNSQEIITTDLALIQKALKLVKFTPELTSSVIDINEVFEQIKTSLEQELNTFVELTNGEKFYRLNNHDGIILVPKMYPEYSCTKVLTEQAMSGVSIKKLTEQKPVTQAEHEMRVYLAKTLINNYLKQIFTDNYFHADPHPGNILFEQLAPNDPAYNEEKTQTKTFDLPLNTTISLTKGETMPPYRLVYLDFGMMGTLSKSLANQILNVVIALNSKDHQLIGESILELCNRKGRIDEVAFFGALQTLMMPYLNMEVSEINFATLSFEIIDLCADYNLQMKPEVTLLLKSFSELESIVAKLDPTISFLDVARPFAKKYVLQHFNLENEIDDQLISLYHAANSLPQLPTKLNNFFDNFNLGRGRLNLNFANFPDLIKSMDLIINRLIIAIILAAIIIGSSLLVEGSDNHPTIYNLGVTGYFLSLGITIILVIGSAIQHYKQRKRRNKKD